MSNAHPPTRPPQRGTYNEYKRTTGRLISFLDQVSARYNGYRQGTQGKISCSRLIQLADLVETNSIRTPQSIMDALRDTIRMRKECHEWHAKVRSHEQPAAEKTRSDQGRFGFIEVLRTIWSKLLRPIVASNTIEMEDDGTRDDHSYFNYYSCLDTADDFAEDHDTTTYDTEAVYEHQSDAVTEPDLQRGTKASRRDAKRKDLEIFQAWCYFNDMKALRACGLEESHKYINGNSSLLACAQAFDSALLLMTDVDNSMGNPSYSKLTAQLGLLYFKKGMDTGATTKFGPKGNDSAESSQIDILCADAWHTVGKFHAGNIGRGVRDPEPRTVWDERILEVHPMEAILDMSGKDIAVLLQTVREEPSRLSVYWLDQLTKALVDVYHGVALSAWVVCAFQMCMEFVEQLGYRTDTIFQECRNSMQTIMGARKAALPGGAIALSHYGRSNDCIQLLATALGADVSPAYQLIEHWPFLALHQYLWDLRRLALASMGHVYRQPTIVLGAHVYRVSQLSAPETTPYWVDMEDFLAARPGMDPQQKELRLAATNIQRSILKKVGGVGKKPARCKIRPSSVYMDFAMTEADSWGPEDELRALQRVRDQDRASSRTLSVAHLHRRLMVDHQLFEEADMYPFELLTDECTRLIERLSKETALDDQEVYTYTALTKIAMEGGSPHRSRSGTELAREFGLALTELDIDLGGCQRVTRLGARRVKLEIEVKYERTALAWVKPGSQHPSQACADMQKQLGTVGQATSERYEINLKTMDHESSAAEAEKWATPVLRQMGLPYSMVCLRPRTEGGVLKMQVKSRVDEDYFDYMDQKGLVSPSLRSLVDGRQ